MVAFRILLVVLFAGVCGYTVVVVSDHGLGLFPVFFGDIAKLGWPGQFNLDFLGFLVLSGFWLAWRHHFSPGGWSWVSSASWVAFPCSRPTSLSSASEAAPMWPNS